MEEVSHMNCYVHGTVRLKYNCALNTIFSRSAYWLQMNMHLCVCVCVVVGGGGK